MLNLRLKDARPGARTITVDVTREDLEVLKRKITNSEPAEGCLLPEGCAHTNIAQGNRVLNLIEYAVHSLIAS